MASVVVTGDYTNKPVKDIFDVPIPFLEMLLSSIYLFWPELQVGIDHFLGTIYTFENSRQNHAGHSILQGHNRPFEDVRWSR
jgi:hypothetical protein